jgi:DNA (cytosine-5)-methyltransferase 1
MGLFAPPVMESYRTARQIIDWSVKGQSIFGRKKPLSPNTIRRIYAGLEKFCGWPFIVPQLSGGSPRRVDQPVPTITTTSRGIGLCEPFVVVLRKNNEARSIDDPLSTISTSGAHHALCQPFIVPVNHGTDLRSHDIDKPMPTITTVDAWGLIEPFIINSVGPDITPRSANDPLNTVLTREHLGLVQVEPFILAMEHGGHLRSIDSPINTITTAKGGAHALIQPYPYIVKYYGTANGQSIDDPLDTVTVKDRFGLVEPRLSLADLRLDQGDIVAFLDIFFRMLQPHELAAAMSFPKTYFFVGNREQQVKQIGNAVPVRTAKALIKTILSGAIHVQRDQGRKNHYATGQTGLAAKRRTGRAQLY